MGKIFLNVGQKINIRNTANYKGRTSTTTTMKSSNIFKLTNTKGKQKSLLYILRRSYNIRVKNEDEPNP
jgi:hypothetical protein